MSTNKVVQILKRSREWIEIEDKYLTDHENECDCSWRLKWSQEWIEIEDKYLSDHENEEA